MGIDAGNSKTLAVLADRSGRVLGFGRSAPANIYLDFGAAVASLRAAYGEALARAGASRVAHLAVSATGADWPEDFRDLRRDLAAFGPGTGDALTLVNDAVGALWTGSPTGEGVAVAVGTSAGTGARRGDRVWHSSFWQEPEGAVHLGQQALRAVYRAALELGPPTRLSEAVLEHLGLNDVEAVLHGFTARDATLGAAAAGGLARVLLQEADGGDPVAGCLVRRHARGLGDLALVAARQVGLRGQAFPLILTGGVMRSPGALLKKTLIERVQREEPGARPQAPEFEPVGGAVCLALAALGVHDARARATLRATLPRGSFYDT